MLELNLNVKFKTGPKKRRQQEESTISATQQSQRKINWQAIAVTAVIVWGGYQSYKGYLKIKPVIDFAENVKEQINSLKKLNIDFNLDWLNSDKEKQSTKKGKNPKSVKFLEIGKNQPAVGEFVSGYRITSPRGWRIHPVTGKRRWHNGVDLATPVGTAIYAVADGTNECKNQPEGAGIYSDFTFGNNKLMGRYFHLSDCKPGKFSVGDVIARTGNTGISTGPHLHIELQKNGESITPSKSFIKYSLQPFSSSGSSRNRYDGTRVATDGLTPNVAAFLDTIAYAEGTFREDGYEITYGYEKITNFDRHPDKVICRQYNGRRLCSSAAGRYQFMPTTWAEVKQSDFSPESQDKGAIALLESRGILSLIENGQIALAIHKAGPVWASFPNNNYGQRQVAMKELLDFYEKRKKEYKR